MRSTLNTYRVKSRAGILFSFAEYKQAAYETYLRRIMLEQKENSKRKFNLTVKGNRGVPGKSAKSDQVSSNDHSNFTTVSQLGVGMWSTFKARRQYVECVVTLKACSC